MGVFLTPRLGQWVSGWAAYQSMFGKTQKNRSSQNEGLYGGNGSRDHVFNLSWPPDAHLDHTLNYFPIPLLVRTGAIHY